MNAAERALADTGYGTPGPKGTVSFGELGLTVDILTKAHGYDPTAVPEPVAEATELAMTGIRERVSLRAESRFFETITVHAREGVVVVGDHSFNCGTVVSSQLAGSSACILFLCTAGPAMETWSKELMAAGDLLTGYAVDQAASEAVERGMDRFQETVKTWLSARDLAMTNRYSPGYCGWSVADQQVLFSLFGNNLCGISLSESSLMHPIKSISGIIGAGPHVRYRDYGCALCDLKDCFRRRVS